MSVNIVITTAGRAALVNAQHTGTAPVTITQVGLSQTAVTPTAAATSLPGEFKRLAGVAGEVVAADTIHINVSDDSADAYSLRSFALYLADGTLFGIYGQADPLIVKSAASIPNMAIDVIFADISAALLTFGNTNFLNPPATTERQGVVELATVPEAQAGIDALRALTPAAAKAAILGWLLAQDGSGSGLDADLLDGQDGDYYANVAARLGYNPVNRAGDTMTGLLVLSGDPTAAMHAATRQWVLGQIASGALGYTPVNRAGDTMAGLLALSGAPTANLHAATKKYVDDLVAAAALLAKILTVDGSGSGLDADLLDGLDSTAFAKVAGTFFQGNNTGIVSDQDWTLFFLRNNHGSASAIGHTSIETLNENNITTGSFQVIGEPDGSTAISLSTTPAGSRTVDRREVMAYLRGQGRPHHFYASAMYLNGDLMWNAGNDGSGSGLDADLLDGFHASDFQRASDGTKFGSNANGYWEERANGFVEQWGTITGTFYQGQYTHTFPRPFGDAASVNIQLTPYNPTGGTTQPFDWWPQRGTTDGTSFNWTLQDSSAAGIGQGVDWRAIGKL